MLNKSDYKDLNKDIFNNLSELFWVLSDVTRIRILYLLNEKAMHVWELSKLFNNKQSLISHKLSTLRKANLVSFKKEGRGRIYFLSNPKTIEIINKARNLGGINYEKEV